MHGVQRRMRHMLRNRVPRMHVCCGHVQMLSAESAAHVDAEHMHRLRDARLVWQDRLSLQRVYDSMR